MEGVLWLVLLLRFFCGGMWLANFCWRADLPPKASREETEAKMKELNQR